MSVIFKVFNCHTVKKEIWQCQQKQKSARKLKKHLRKQESYFSKRIRTRLLSDTLIFPVDNCELFFPINKPKGDEGHFFPPSMSISLPSWEEKSKNHVQAFIVSFFMKKIIKGRGVSNFFNRRLPSKACDSTTYTL